MAAAVASLPSFFDASSRDIPSDKLAQMPSEPSTPGPSIGNSISSLSGSLQKNLISALIATPIAFREAEDANPTIQPTANMILLDDTKLSESSSEPHSKDALTPGAGRLNAQNPLAPVIHSVSGGSNAPEAPKSLYPIEIPNEWVHRTRNVGVGLNNVGNTCFLNSVLQCLLHTPALIWVASKHTSSQRCPASVGTFCMTCKFKDLATKTITANVGPSSYTPIPVLQNLKSIAKSLRHGRQEDAHEFLRYTVDAFQRSALHGTDPKLPHGIKETTWVHQIFGGRLRSRVTCRSCSHPSDTFDSLLDLSIDVARRPSIRAALDSFVSIDVLAGADKYKCEKCKKPVEAEKQFTIHDAPQILTIHLKRFTPLGRKVSHSVRYEEHLSLHKYMSAGQFGPRYSLYAVISHFGSGPNSGHYLAHVKAKNGRWYEMNDDSVEQCSRIPLDLKNAYVLFYAQDAGQALEAAISASGLAAPAEILPRKSVQNQGQKKRKAMFDDDDEEDLGTKVSPPDTEAKTKVSPTFEKPDLLGHKAPEIPSKDPAAIKLAARITAATKGKSITLSSSALLALSEYTNDSSEAETNDGGSERDSQVPGLSLPSSSTLVNTTSTPSIEKDDETVPQRSDSVLESPPSDSIDPSPSKPFDTPIPQSSFYGAPQKKRRHSHLDENSARFPPRFNRSKKHDHKRRHKHTPFSRDALRSNLHEDRSNQDQRTSMASRMKPKMNKRILT
ncbi:uncharacterized protein EI90DRAFT_2403689 [Cantharellus anzutake]|uniref:uncharacterized protein n=1 Tax=Cantharellus anzutake TaxID=1750568 RepID=UPI0019039FE1|nr:uncharacterized protein EI90DRAFT_2403689 [Cantharellus anzutake]KAF8338711.1 hypothetical protein EI90DRAFT_2403689 [Cantharellus anzutake]